MSQKSKLIANSTPHIRKILFNLIKQNGVITNVIIAPILSARRNSGGLHPTTYQGIPDGDIVLCSTELEPNQIQINRINSSDPPLTPYEKSTILSLVPEELLAWLRDIKDQRCTGFIPEPFGWINGMTKTEAIKYEKIQKLFKSNVVDSNLKQDWIKSICEKGVISPRDGLTLNWQDAKRFPKNHMLYLDADSYVEAEIIYIRKRVLELQSFKKIIFVGDWSNKTVKRPIPWDVDSLILIKHGVALNSDGESFGISIELFRSR